MIRRTRQRWTVRDSRLGVALWALAFVFAATAASADRTETLRWTHPNVAGISFFTVHVGATPGNYVDTNVGIPTPAGNVYSYDVTVGDDESIYVCISATDTEAIASICSNVQLRAPESQVPPDDDPPPDPPMGLGDLLWLDDFQAAAPNVNAVSGWVDTGTSRSLNVDDSLFQVVSIGGTQALATSSEDTNIHSHYIGNDSEGLPASQWSNYEYRGRMRMSDSRAGIGVTVYSQFTSDTDYYRLRRLNNYPLELSTGVSGARCTDTPLGPDMTTDTWYHFAIQVYDSGTETTVSAKVWASSDAEPESWQASCVDDAVDRPATGNVGVWSLSDGTKYWDDLRIYAVPTDLGQPGKPSLVEE